MTETYTPIKQKGLEKLCNPRDFMDFDVKIMINSKAGYFIKKRYALIYTDVLSNS